MLVTGLILLASGRLNPGQMNYAKLPWTSALWIGIAQAFALLPGLSRSGSTIAAGLGLGLSRPQAATFSFLLAIPALAGAGVLGGIHLLKNPASTSVWLLALGACVSFAVGLVALWWLNRWLAKGRLHLFGWYCITLGLVVLAMEASRWLT